MTGRTRARAWFGGSNKTKRVCKAALRVDGKRADHDRDDVHRAREIWAALLEGEWRLMEVFVQRGRKYLVARRVKQAEPLLTERERRVMGLRAQAQGIKSIATRLCMSQATVRRVLVQGMRKLGVASAAELARFETL